MGDRAREKLAKKWRELLCPFPRGGAGSPSNTMSPGAKPISVPGGTLIPDASSGLATIDMVRKVGPRPTSIPSGS